MYGCTKAPTIKFRDVSRANVTLCNALYLLSNLNNRGHFSFDFIALPNSGCSVTSLGVGAWRSLVAHLLGVQGVVSSNLAAPTICLIFFEKHDGGPVESLYNLVKISG